MKTRGNEALKCTCLSHILSSKKWFQIAWNALQIYIKSNQSLRRFCLGTAQRNEMLSHRTTAREVQIRAPSNGKHLESEICKICRLQITVAESQYNNGNECKQLAVFRCNPMEQSSNTFEKS